MLTDSSIPRHIQVDYDDPSHRYFLGDVRYTSATQLIARFKPKFDPEVESVLMAERHGQTPQYWKDKWRGTTARALTRGNRIHDNEENFLYYKGFDSVDGREYRVHRQAVGGTHVPYIELPDGVYPEMKLWRHDYQLAGRSDKAILRTVDRYTSSHTIVLEGDFRLDGRRGLRVMDIEDYKTNQKIRTESFYTRDESGAKVHKMMLGPLSHLMDCEEVHYSLQFSLYQFMGEYHGFLPGKRRLIFFRNDDTVHGGLLKDLPGETRPIVRELPYLRSEVIAMLQWGNRPVT